MLYLKFYPKERTSFVPSTNLGFLKVLSKVWTLSKPGFPLTPNSGRVRGKVLCYTQNFGLYEVQTLVNKLCLFTLGDTFRQNFIKNEVFNLGFRETETWLRSKIAPRNQGTNIIGALDKAFR
jgi:hypothetical protein